MADRPDFNLDDLLGPEYVRHYLHFIEGGGDEFMVNADAVSYGGMRPGLSASWSDHEGPPSLLEEYARRIGFGPGECSPSTELALVPEVCWDVCGYYHRLGAPAMEHKWGIPFWKASRRQLTDCYLAKNGQNSKYLTYALAQLFNAELREVYNRVPLGELFMPDKDVQEMIKRKAAVEAARSTLAGHGMEADDVLREWGFKRVKPPADDGEPSFRQLPEYSAPDPDDDHQLLGGGLPEWQRHWSWYCMEPRRPDATELPQWQQLLREAFRTRGLTRARFAVGVGPGTGFRVHQSPSDPVAIILLGTEPPTPDLAMRAVNGWMAHHRKGVSHAQFFQGRRGR